MAEQNYTVKMNMEGKNIIVAYLLWWFLGWAGVHRFYLGRVKSGIAQLLLVLIGGATWIILIGYLFIMAWFIWWLLDAFFTYKMVEEENEKRGLSSSSISFSKSGDMHSELEQLEKLHALYEKGALTREQYEEKKSRLI